MLPGHNRGLTVRRGPQSDAGLHPNVSRGHALRHLLWATLSLCGPEERPFLRDIEKLIRAKVPVLLAA